MSTQLEQLGISLTQGYDPAQLQPPPDLVIIGNALSRGNPAVEYVLEHNLPYTSGPQWLSEQLLQQRWVLAVSGTHGKTSTASMLAWILDYAGLKPGFLIGGVPQNFGVSARLGDAPFFVIEADEYDTAFFDKRSKFVHYRPRTLVINNLEYDHADIFPDLAAIQRQFHHLLRTVPASGLVLSPEATPAVAETLALGCWSQREAYGSDWQAELLTPDGSQFALYWQQQQVATVNWQLSGQHNVDNAVMAIAAARHAGVPVGVAAEALASFVAPKRRMELKGSPQGIAIYDDFAHHPTAIATTLQGLRAKVGQARIIAVLEPRSNTMRLGVHQAALPQALSSANQVFLYEPRNAGWSMAELAARLSMPASVCYDIAELKASILALAQPGDQIVIMSNGAFGGIHQQLLEALS
jgi:UDP-N-acetylmuramate: L-alanyl-gamma-D-glutamyl-meso-diaminopimelate ligase